MTHTEKMRFVMQEAHAWAKLHKSEFNTYREALSVAMKIAWSVVKGSPVAGTEGMVDRYNAYMGVRLCA